METKTRSPLIIKDKFKYIAKIASKKYVAAKVVFVIICITVIEGDF